MHTPQVCERLLLLSSSALTNHGSQPEFADLVATRESATTRILSAQRQDRSVSVKFDKRMGVRTYLFFFIFAIKVLKGEVF